jgi:hypothetical protein
VTPRGLFVGALAVSLLNGLTSPMTVLVYLQAPLWMPGFLPATPQIVYHAAVVFVAVGTLLLAGVPAAVVERIRRQTASDRGSMALWLGVTVLLTLPGLLVLSTRP